MIHGAFIAWQINASQKNFRDYLESLGLVEKLPKPVREAQKKAQVRRSLKNANRIINLDKKRCEKRGDTS